MPTLSSWARVVKGRCSRKPKLSGFQNRMMENQEESKILQGTIVGFLIHWHEQNPQNLVIIIFFAVAGRRILR
jgi:hypothetical protein